MAKKNFYAVRCGKTPGIYLTWEQCKQQVEGYPGAIYKGFATKEEAESFVQGRELQNVSATEFPAEPPKPEDGAAVAYVDGSYNAETAEYSCGVVFFYDGEEIHLAEKGQSEELAQMRNVAGEILGAERAMQEALAKGAKKLTIFHDYQGIASWCLGDWNTNKEGTQAYKAYYDSVKTKIDITFSKVKGHSGDTWNDLADELAKSVIF